jgi:type IV secretory pathway component VirB8
MDGQKLAELDTKIKQIDQKLAAIYKSVEKTRKYFLWTLIISVVVFVLPLVGIAFVIPLFLGSLSSYSLF